jgi:hypothetical protein
MNDKVTVEGVVHRLDINEAGGDFDSGSKTEYTASFKVGEDRHAFIKLKDISELSALHIGQTVRITIEAVR